MTVQAALCQTCSETTLLVFPRGGSNHAKESPGGTVAFARSIRQYHHMYKYITCSTHTQSCHHYSKLQVCQKQVMLKDVGENLLYIEVMLYAWGKSLSTRSCTHSDGTKGGVLSLLLKIYYFLNLSIKASCDC